MINNKKIIAETLALFPELQQARADYDRSESYVWDNYQISDPHFRDNYSAGGKVDIPTSNGVFSGLPHIYIVIYENKNSIINVINSTPEQLLRDTWGVLTIENNRVCQWIKIVSAQRSNQFLKVLQAVFWEDLT